MSTPSSPPLKVGLIGAGIFASRSHAPVLKDNPEIFKCVEVWSRSIQSSETLATTIFSESLTANDAYSGDDGYDALLDKVEAVSIALRKSTPDKIWSGKKQSELLKNPFATTPRRRRSTGWMAWVTATVLAVIFLSPSVSGQRARSDEEFFKNPLAGMERELERVTQILQQDPRNATFRAMLGWNVMSTPGGGMGYPELGIRLLEECFDTNIVDNPLMGMPALVSASTIGRYRFQYKDYDKSEYFIMLAYNISKTEYPQISGKPFDGFGEPCLHMQLATTIHPFPKSMQHADESLETMNRHARDLLQRFRAKSTHLNDAWLSQAMPGAGADPYIHCCLTLFPLSFFYRADVAAVASQHYYLTVAGWPDLGVNLAAPHVQRFEQERLQNRNGAQQQPPPPCVNRKIKLGVIAATLGEGHSVSEDFGGVLSRLDRNIFEIYYIFVYEREDPMPALFTQKHPHSDRIVRLYKDEKRDAGRGAWIRRLGNEIAGLELDQTLFLDLTMSSFMRRIGMLRLAPVQLNTHGHPVTSGHPREIMQHFVSWAEAELPYHVAQTHYTEELQLIPHGKIHQYYERRIIAERNISRMDGMPFGHLTRRDYGLPNPDEADIHVYVCMQKPFKLHPEFDALVCGILQADLDGHAVLHKEESERNHNTFLERLSAAGCDMNRVHFLPVQPNHRLIGLFQQSTLVLDSYPAGGCTTTREVLELGKAVVTWPARLLGGRWSLAYYNIINLDPHAKEALVAHSEEEYIAKAVALGKNRTLLEYVEASIREATPRLFGRYEAVEEWQKILLRTSPVRQCTGMSDEL